MEQLSSPENTGPIDIRASKDVFRFIVRPMTEADPRSAGYLADAYALGLQAVVSLHCQDLYFIEGQVSEADLQRLATELLSDPITQHAQWGRLIFAGDSTARAAPAQPGGGYILEVALRPGVTDPVAEQIVRAARVLGISGVERASTGLRFVIGGPGLGEADLHLLARRLLANPVIQQYSLGPIRPSFPQPAEASGQVKILPLRASAPRELLELSQARLAALDLDEMLAIQAYFQEQARDPTDVEFETLAQTWSEHCVHKTFKARIDLPEVEGERDKQAIDGLLRTYLRAATDQIGAPWVRSAFVDNAGILDFDDEFEISFKVETHNHPSAIEPFGGANTGVGGVIRDVLGVSARPIAATDALCFGPQEMSLEDLPEGVLHPRRIRSGVVAGIQDYGNKIGIPTVNGAILYDAGYVANPLVFCGCVGLAPRDSHPRQPQPGDRVIVLGGRTGRDGLRGATFSSMTMDGQTGEVSGASVQIGDPITEKGLIEVIIRARDDRLYHAITDCGAGGLSSAVGEMASRGGADVELASVRLKYPGLAPWEIFLSEAQERMVLAVPPESLPALQSLCDTFEVELTDIGCFTPSGRLVVRYAGQPVLDLDNAFLYHGIPQRHLGAALLQPPSRSPDRPLQLDANAVLLALLEHPDIACKADVIHRYDHEVQGATAIKPLGGPHGDSPSDACVLKPAGTRGERGVVLANGINPQYGKLDPYRMAISAVDEAVRNAVAAGADPQRIALLDNFCWGDPRRPETLGGLVAAAQGCYEAALHYQAPFISGKDSLNNEYLGADGVRHAIPPTLLISSIAILPNVYKAVSTDLKAPGDYLYLAGELQPALGGSHLALVAGEQLPPGDYTVPGLPQGAPQLYRALHAAMQAGLVRACHDLSEGGLAVAAAEMCIGGRLGLSLQMGGADPLLDLFGECNGCLLVEVAPDERGEFEARLRGCALWSLGVITQALVLQASTPSGEVLLSLGVDELASAWNRQV